MEEEVGGASCESCQNAKRMVCSSALVVCSTASPLLRMVCSTADNMVCSSASPSLPLRPTPPRRVTLHFLKAVGLFCVYACLSGDSLFMSLFMSSYTSTSINTYLRTYTCACVHICMHTYMQTNIPTHMITCIHAYIHTNIHIYIHSYIHTYIDTCLHTYMNTCMHIDECLQEMHPQKYIHRNTPTEILTEK